MKTKNREITILTRQLGENLKIIESQKEIIADLSARVSELEADRAKLLAANSRMKRERKTESVFTFPAKK